MRVAVLGVLAAVAMMGCAQAINHSLQRVSAREISPTPYPDSVAISDLQRGLSTTKWVATAAGGVYDCSIEGDEKFAICVKRAAPR